jgi:WD40 repeat protein
VEKGGWSPSSIARSPDGRILATGGQENVVRLWDGESSKPLRVLEGDGEKLRAVAFKSNAEILVGSDNGSAQLLNIATGEIVLVLKGHTGPVVSVDVSPDGKLFVTASHDRTVRLWTADGKCLKSGVFRQAAFFGLSSRTRKFAQWLGRQMVICWQVLAPMEPLGFGTLQEVGAKRLSVTKAL